MKLIKFFVVGFLFGLVLTKCEAISWYRIYEMFHFQSFHMYGVILTAVLTGIVGVYIIKTKNAHDIYGNPIVFWDKEKNITRYLAGGVIFGLGWALVGACPGPIFILLGIGIPGAAVVLVGALLGTFVYGIIRKYLPH